MKACAKLLGLCPEVLTGWNYRRETVEARESEREQATVAEGDAKAQASTSDDWWSAELALSETALRNNPKSYPSWYHRKWVIERLIAKFGKEKGNVRDVLEREHGLCVKLLEADDRNFHCWAYRRFIVKLLERSSDDELAYTMTKIESNFSNYSAWHHRSAELTARGELTKETLDAEFELVANAFYTEPEDQSAWMYHRWLTLRAKELPDERERSDTLEKALAVCREVSELEPGCKWPLLAQVIITEKREEETFERLASIDPARRGYYRDVVAAGSTAAS